MAGHIDLRQAVRDFRHARARALHIGGDDHAFRSAAGDAAHIDTQLPGEFARIGRGFAARDTGYGFSGTQCRYRGRCGFGCGGGRRALHCRRFVMHLRYFVFGGDDDGGVHHFARLVDDEGHGVADFHHAADIGHRAGQKTFVKDFDIHDGFVGFDRGHDVAALDHAAHFFFPRHHYAFGHGIGELRHDHSDSRVMRNHLGRCLLGDDFIFRNGEIARCIGNVAQGGADRHGAADFGQRPRQITGLEHFHIHDGFVGFDRGHDIATFDAVAGLLFPRHHDPFGHGVGELRHGDDVM